MPLFHYKAVTQDGEALQGELEARSVDGVVEQLQRMGYLPIRIQEHNARQSSWLWQRARVSSKQVREMTGQLATLLRAGLPLDRAFELQIQLAGDPAMTELMQRIRDEVRGGSTLSAALEQHRGVFSRFYINMVRAGEMGGSLAEVLARIHEFMERAAELRSTVVSAMIYPAILASASLVSVFVLLLGVVPKFSQMFAQSGKSLPLITQFVIGLGNFLRHDGWMLLLAALLVVVVIKQQRSTAMGRLRWDARLLSWPLLGDLMLKFETARMARSLATLVANGVSLLPALGIIKEIMGNQLLALGMEEVAERLKEGQGMAKPLQQTGLFPLLAVQMVLVGEETGELDQMLYKVADIYDREVQVSVKRLLSLMEPALILGMGLIVAGIIVSILMAILSVNDLVK